MKKGDRVKHMGSYWKIIDEFRDSFLILSIEGFTIDKIPRLERVK